MKEKLSDDRICLESSSRSDSQFPMWFLCKCFTEVLDLFETTKYIKYYYVNNLCQIALMVIKIYYFQRKNKGIE